MKINNQIKTLKSEIQQLKTSSALATTSPASPQPLSNIPSSELESKLASYQSFMAEYIVNSQNEKLLAVKEAELKAEKKFQERLEKLFEASGMALPADSSSTSTAGVDSGRGGGEETLFQKRNAYIIQAANAGSSRWGSKEIERAIEQTKSSPTSVSSSSSSTAPESTTTAVNASPFDMRNAQIVAAANAGVSRWGEKEVERAAKINNGATATSSPTPATAPVTLEDRINLGSSTAFESRNVQVVASAAAGKSRWGDKEVERAMESNGATVTKTAPSTTAISLDDRVNLGARLLGV